MKIEVGKYYNSADGRKVGPMYEFDDHAKNSGVLYARVDDKSRAFYIDGGKRQYEGYVGDLISEWTDEPTAEDRPHMTLPNGDVIYEGEYGVMRGGDKVGPAVYTEGYFSLDGMHRNSNGVCCYKGEIGRIKRPQLDLVAKWRDTAETPTETGTLRELNVKPGDVVRYLGNRFEVMGPDGSEFLLRSLGRGRMETWAGDDDRWRIISRATPTPPSPVITERVTTQRIVPGQYGVLAIAGACSDCVELEFTGEYGPTGRSRLTREELTQAIATLTQIRDALK